MINEDLQDFHFLEWFAWMHHSFHIAKAVEDGRPLIFVQSVDLSAVLYEQPADIRIGVDISGMEGKMMQGIPFVHIKEIGVYAKCQQVLYLFDGKILASLDNFDKGDFILGGAEVDLALVLSQSDDELVLAIQRGIEDRKGLIGIEAIGVKANR